MLVPDLLSEVLHFFDRRYLTKLQLHGRGLRDIVDAVCAKYPLAPLDWITIRVLPPSSAVVEMVIANWNRRDIETVDFFDAVCDVKVLLQKSYVRLFEFCAHSRQDVVTKRQWSALVSAIQSATIEIIYLKRMDLAGVEADQVKRILNASCLEEVVLKWCRIRTASISDAFLTLCRTNGVTRLMVHGNDVVDGVSLSVTKEAIFDYCFRTERRHGTTVIRLGLSIVHLSDTFLRRLIKMMEDSKSGRPYHFGFVGVNALPGPDEFRQYELDRSNTRVSFRIRFAHNSYESFHILHYTCASV